MDFSKCELSLHPQLERRVASTESAYDTIAQEAWIRVIFYDPGLAPVAVVGQDFDSAAKRLRAILTTYVSLPSLNGALRSAGSPRTRRFAKPPNIVIPNAGVSVSPVQSAVDR